MGSVKIKMRGNHTISIKEMADILKREIKAELISVSWRSFDEFNVILLSFEKYYMRNGSYASLTIMLTEHSSMQAADIVGSGGGEGIFNISWGANTNFARMAADQLRKHGFREE